MMGKLLNTFQHFTGEAAAAIAKSQGRKSVHCKFPSA